MAHYVDNPTLNYRELHHSTGRDPLDVLPRLSLSAAQGRFGMDFVQVVASHAGYTCTEPRSGDDVRALDATLGFDYGVAHVQVKCTTKDFTQKAQTIRIPTEPWWAEAWRKAGAPVYLVVIRVPEQSNWVSHHDAHTLLNATAYWTRIVPAAATKSVVVPKSQRFTTETLRDWARERQIGFGVSS